MENLRTLPREQREKIIAEIVQINERITFLKSRKGKESEFWLTLGAEEIERLEERREELREQYTFATQLRLDV